MSIIVTCACGRHFATPEANAGRRARCVVCGHEMTLPGLTPPATEVLFLADMPEPTVTSGKAIASITLGVLLFFGCLSGLPAIVVGMRALREIGQSGGRLRGRGMAVGGILLGLAGCIITFASFVYSFNSAREGARRAQCVSNLKQIGLALQNYHSFNGCLPAAAITDKNGRPLLSWRVALLPEMEQNALFAQFHLDEPWDSPHNLTLLSARPNIYTCASDTTLKPGMTNFQVVIGRDTAFTPDFKPLRFDQFTDGLNNTMLVGESRRSVPWTKPEDLPFDMSVPHSGLSSHHGYGKNGFNTLFADGSVKFLNSSITPGTLRALLTRNGNEAVSKDRD